MRALDKNCRLIKTKSLLDFTFNSDCMSDGSSGTVTTKECYGKCYALIGLPLLCTLALNGFPFNGNEVSVFIYANRER